MREEEAFVLLTGFVFVVVLVAMRNAHNERVQRLKVLDRALQDPKVDPATRQELVRSLDHKRHSGIVGAWRSWLLENLTPRRVFGAIALGLIVIGSLVATFGGRSDGPVGVGMLAIGIAVLALPIVLRELDTRAARR